MTKAIENKWKRFAIAQTLSDWYEHTNLDDLYDCMMLEDEIGLQELFDEHDVIVWEAFENWPLTMVAEYVQQLAEAAQQTAGESK